MIHHQQGESAKTINERKTPELDGLFTGVGLYSFEKTATIVISNKDANGYVVVDAVQLLKKK